MALLPGALAQSANTWIQKADFGGFTRVNAIGFSIRSKGYLGLGSGTGPNSFPIDFWEYDPSTNAWTQKANFAGAGRSGAVAFSIGVMGYVGTGLVSGSPSPLNTADFWEYDPVANSWMQKAPFPGGARARATGFSIGIKGYVGLGQNASQSYTDFWEYDPSTNTWVQKASMMSYRTGAPGFSIGNKGYVGPGGGWGQFEFWEYSPVSNTWTQKAAYPGFSTVNLAGFNIGTKGYIGTGYYFPTTCASDFWEYSPVANTWSQVANFGGGNRDWATSFSIGAKGYVGCGSNSSHAPQKDFWEYSPAPYAYLPDINGSPFCPGASLTLSFTTVGSFNAGNVFSAQLSDAVGSFANPAVIGTAIGTTSGNIAITFPLTLPPGTGYRIRLVSSNPYTVGDDNGVNLAISASTPVYVTISTPLSNLCNGSQATFTAVPVNPGTNPSWQWRVNNQMAGTNSPVFTFTPAHHDTVMVLLTSSMTCPVPNPASSNKVGMNLLLGNLTITPTALSFCQGSSATLFADTSISVTSRQWQLGSANIPGATGSSLSVSVAGTYKVVVTNGGCTGTSPPVTVTVYPLPTPLIQYLGNGLMTTSTYASYQWCRDTVLIPGATAQSYMATLSGNYTVRVTDQNGCKGMALAYAFTRLGVGEVRGNGIRLYPNPASDKLYIQSPVSVGIVIRNMQGQLVMKATDLQQVDISTLADGVYTIGLSDKSGVRIKTQRFIKMSR